VKLYISRGEQAMPVALRSFAQRVEDLAREFKSVAGSNMVIELYNPKPDSEDEDAAQLDGVEPQQLSRRAVLSRAHVSQLDRKQAIPRCRRSASACSSTTSRAPSRASRRPSGRCRPDERAAGARRALQPDDAAEFRALGARHELKRDFNVKLVPFMAESIDPESRRSS